MLRAWHCFTALSLALLAACGVQLLIVADRLEEQAALIERLTSAEPASLVRSQPRTADPGLERVELGVDPSPGATSDPSALPMPTVRLVGPTASVQGPTMQATLPTLPVLPTWTWPTPVPTPTPPGA